MFPAITFYKSLQDVTLQIQDRDLVFDLNVARIFVHCLGVFAREIRRRPISSNVLGSAMVFLQVTELRWYAGTAINAAVFLIARGLFLRPSERKRQVVKGLNRVSLKA